MTAALGAAIHVRPQPVGVFPPPVSFLLLPDDPSTPDSADALAALLQGDGKVLLRDSWRFYRLALQGRMAEAEQAIVGNSPVAAYNRFVLRPDAADYPRLRAELPDDLRCLLEAAAFASGVTEEKPRLPAALDSELRAVALLTCAAWHLEREEEEAARALLAEAVECCRDSSPLLAAQILHQLGTIERVTAPAKAVERYKQALALAGGGMLVSLRAELWLNLGIAWQDAAMGRRGPLLEACKAYQESIRCGLSLENYPEMYALAQNNLALAYLTMPAGDTSDQLRMGIAVQGLREALKVFKRDTHAELWSSAQLNLANALQYLPSSHPEENLQQAVHIYEELLGVRNKAMDPLGYARLLANQANALAHLGIFGPALEKLSEAHKLFHWHGEPDMAASALGLAAEINGRLGKNGRPE